MGITSYETIVVKANFELPLGDQSKVFGADATFFIDSSFLGVGLGFAKISNGVETDTFGIQSFVTARIPLNFYKFTVSPYAQVGFGMAPASFKPMLHIFYDAGFAVSFDINSTIYPGFGVAYRGRQFKDFMESNYEGDTSAVLIYISLGF